MTDIDASNLYHKRYGNINSLADTILISLDAKIDSAHKRYGGEGGGTPQCKKCEVHQLPAIKNCTKSCITP